MQVDSSSINWLEVVMSGLGAGASTWIGAYFAFRHERSDKQAHAHREEGEALRRALFLLWCRESTLKHLKRTVLEVHEKDPHRFFRMRPIHVTSDEMPHGTERLLFVLNTNADLLYHLYVSNRVYSTVIDAIRFRNELHTRMQGILAAKGVVDQPIAPEILRNMVGPDLWSQLEQVTDGLYVATRDALAGIAEDIPRIEALLKEQYPEVERFSVTPIPPRALSDGISKD